MNASKSELRKLQEKIADGRPPPLPEGKAEEYYWHDRMPGFALRLYANGTGKWILQYRNERGLGRKYTIGNAAALTLDFATEAAKITIGKIASGIDPQGEREEKREKENLTLGALVKRMVAERREGKDRLSPNTLRNYVNISDNHLAGLARKQVDLIDKTDVRERIKQAEKVGGPYLATQLRATISAVYTWATEQGIISCANPAWKTYRPELPESSRRSLSLDELGAVWRACERLATVPVRYKGNAWGGGVPAGANSVRAGEVLLTRKDAARQSGIDKSTLYRAIKDGELKAETRRDLGIEDHPTKVKQGYHRNTYLISAAELERYNRSRQREMRSPQAEYSAVVRLLILIGGRYSEIGALRWSEIKIDGDQWILHIKGKRTEERRGTKNKRDLRLTLPPMAVDILKEIPRRPDRDFVFGDGPNGLVNNSRLKDELDSVVAEMEGKPLAHWCHHELRHTLTTQLNEMGIDSRVVETVTNHIGGGLDVHGRRTIGHKAGMAGRYNHATYKDPVTQALEDWAKVVRNAADRVNNVVTFGKQSAS